MVAAALDSVNVALERIDLEDDVVLGDADVVHHAAIRGFEPELFDLLAVLVEEEVRHVLGSVTLRLVAVDDGLSRPGIVLGML